MPELNPDQRTYYVDKKIWREAHRLSEAREDAPPIMYYWWLGGNLSAAREAGERLVVSPEELMNRARPISAA